MNGQYKGTRFETSVTEYLYNSSRTTCSHINAQYGRDLIPNRSYVTVPYPVPLTQL